MKPSQLKEENTISWEIHFQGKLKRFDNTYRTVVPFVKAYGTHYSLESTYAVLDPSTCAGIQKFGTSKRIHEALRKKHVQILDQIKQEISVQLTAKQSTTSHTKRIRKRRTQSIPNVHSSALFLGVYYMLQCVQYKSPNTYVIITLKNSLRLAEIIEEKENRITSLQVGGSHIQRSQVNDHMIDFVDDNMDKILKVMATLNQNEWNALIMDFYGLWTVKRMDYTMSTTEKLKEWNIDPNNIINHTLKLSKQLKRNKQYHLRRYETITTDSAKETIENMILRKEYAEALHILNHDDGDMDQTHVNPYYRDVYKMICCQQQYMTSSMEMKKRYFVDMIDTLASLSLTCSSLTNALFAQTLLNYNPYGSSAADDIEFICHLAISGCCWMPMNANDIYQMSGSIDALMLLLALIRDDKLVSNDRIFGVIVDQMDKLFAAFDAMDIDEGVSKCFYLRICRAKMLWQIEKKEIMNTIREIDHSDHEMKVQETKTKLTCPICNKTGFKNAQALFGHRGGHAKRKKREELKKSKRRVSTRGKVGRASYKQESIESDVSEPAKPPIPWTPKAHHGRKSISGRKKVAIMRCDFCDYTSDHRGNLKRHVKLHKENQRKKKSVDDMKINEACLKKERKRVKGYKCNVCGKYLKSKSGVGTHKYYAHGIIGTARRRTRSRSYKESKKKERKNKKRNPIIIDDDSETESDHDVEILCVNTNNAKKKMKFGCDIANCGRTFDSFGKLMTHKNSKHVCIKMNELEDEADEYHDFNVSKCSKPLNSVPNIL